MSDLILHVKKEYFQLIAEGNKKEAEKKGQINNSVNSPGLTMITDLAFNKWLYAPRTNGIFREGLQLRT